MDEKDQIFFAKGDVEVNLLLKMSNRHGLIAGATGTGKTISLKVLAEAFSSMGVPVFLSDIKGDLASLCVPGEMNPKIEERISQLDLQNHSFRSFPVCLWDVFGRLGHPIRTTVSDIGPLLLSRLLGLNETQTGILNIIFKIADDEGTLLLDLKDLKAMLQYVGENSSEFTTEYGNIAKQSVGTIQRNLLTLEQQGAEMFFGEPGLDIKDFLKNDSNGFGYINVLSAEQLFNSPGLYSTFLLWLLSELFEELEEVGDVDKPKIVFFFDEAHLLFDEAPKALLDKIEQVVRLVRSKGVGVYFITQNPADIPDSVLGQLGNKVQHALRAFTPKEQSDIKAAADSFRTNPNFDSEKTILDLKVGEAMISFLDKDGRPSMVERALVLPPQSMIGTISSEKRQETILSSSYYKKYEAMVDRDSAYEMLDRKAAKSNQESQMRAIIEENEKLKKAQYDSPPTKRSNTTSGFERAGKSFMTSFGSQIGREVVRGILGSLLKR